MKDKLLLVVGIAILFLLSGCTMPTELNLENIVSGIGQGALGGGVVGPVAYPAQQLTEEVQAQNCVRDRNGEVCGENEVCGGSMSKSPEIGHCCTGGCREMSEYDECSTNADCDDGDPNTMDICRSIRDGPTKCHNNEKDCTTEFGGAVLCTSRAPTIAEMQTCGDVVCADYQQCINGECRTVDCRSGECVELDCNSEESCQRARRGDTGNIEYVPRDYEHAPVAPPGEDTGEGIENIMPPGAEEGVEDEEIVVGECQTEVDCDDGNVDTMDMCVGVPSECLNGVMECHEEDGERICRMNIMNSS